MAMRTPTERLRFSPRSLITAVALLGATLALLRLIAASQRVIGWLAAAIIIAGLLHPVVTILSRRIPRGLAVLLVTVVSLTSIATAAYALAHDVVKETRALQRSLPRAAAQLERKGRFRRSARDFHLARRTRRFVKQLPARLQGGTPAEVVRAAATRNVAFLATAVLSLFFLLHGPRLARAAANQVHHPGRRARLERVGLAAYRRAFRYVGGTILMAIAAGLLGWLLASLADVPGPAPLGLWVALWDLVPLIGAAIGAVPIVLLAGVASPTRGIVLTLVFLAYQLFEALVLQPRVERRSVHLGPFLTVAAGLIGIELYGLGGAVLAVTLLTMTAAAADELARE